MVRADRSGRLNDRRLLRTLGWTPGRHLSLDVVHGLIVVKSAPTGSHILDDRGALHLPAATRRLCGISHGAPVVLTASIAQLTLVVHHCSGGCIPGDGPQLGQCEIRERARGDVGQPA
ncbi:hypothetical protein [Pseudonocardia acaciae]|uniref:hypothetical protein n=1 Tax=Pseudonocardia acaciae TaxID=551276 RepID=UPI0012EECE64|nr:hypothetical protein [Pseudonocardia acaciae]